MKKNLNFNGNGKDSRGWLEKISDEFPDYFIGNEDWRLKRVQKDPLMLKYWIDDAEPGLDEEIYVAGSTGIHGKMLLEVVLNADQAGFLNPPLKDVNEFVIKVVSKKGCMLQHLPDYQDHWDVVRAAVNNNGYAMKYASDRLKDSIVLASIAIQTTTAAYIFISPGLRNNREITDWAVRMDGMCIQYASEELRNDKDILIKAVSNNGNCLQFIPDNWKDDENIVSAAICQNPLSLQHASPRMRQAFANH